MRTKPAYRRRWMPPAIVLAMASMTLGGCSAYEWKTKRVQEKTTSKVLGVYGDVRTAYTLVSDDGWSVVVNQQQFDAVSVGEVIHATGWAATSEDR